MPIPWRTIAEFALLGTVAITVIVGLDVHRSGRDNLVSLLQPGTKGHAYPLIHQDFPDVAPPESRGLDGQQFYAVARDPIHLQEIAPYFDRPRYRMQHPLMSWLARALHPSGTGGMGLLYALIAVGVIAIYIGGLATGVLSVTLRGPPWLAVVLPLMPGAYWSLRVTVADALALGLAIGAIALAARSKHAAAVGVGVLAVLAKEPVLLLLIGWVLWRRTRRDALVAMVPAAMGIAWAGLLRILVPGSESSVSDFQLPFTGLWDAYRLLWSQGQEWVGMACAIGGFAVGVTALALRRLSHPLSWIIALQVGYLSIMGPNPLGTNFGPTRMAMPLMVLSLVAIFTPNAAAVVPPIRLFSRAGNGGPPTAAPIIDEMVSTGEERSFGRLRPRASASQAR